MTYFIYALLDPSAECQANQVFYVGRTTDPIKRFACRRGWFSSPKRQRLDDMKRKGVSPVLFILEQTPDPMREQFWMDHLRDKGYELLNRCRSSLKLID